MRRTDTMWAIAVVWSNGKEFLYSGTNLRRKDAIDQFCRDMGESWEDQKKRGHRVVKVKVVWDDRT